MASPRIEAVIWDRHRMGECPMWEEETGQLVFVDINTRTVCWWNPLSGEVSSITRGLRVAGAQPGHLLLQHLSPCSRAPEVWAVTPWAQDRRWGDPVGCVALHREGSYVVASGTCLGLLDWATGQVEWAAWLDRDKPHNRFNDGKMDPTGRFVAANPRLVCQLEPEQGMPDGLFMDTTGTLWVACIDGGRVIRMDAETGMRLCTLEMPVSRVTSCCFGGADYSNLYVTSAADSLSPEQLLREPQAGHVFKVLGLGVRGLVSCHFSG
uniref:regucalcin-like n=1 Tax=Callospermophilus lateralis TaxID=76772 RepID=UPI00403882D8